MKKVIRKEHHLQEGFHPGWQEKTQIILISLLILATTGAIRILLPNSGLILPFGLLCFLINTLRLWFSRQIESCFEWLYRWRWAMAGLMFVLLVIGQIHFSNAAGFAESFQAQPSVQNSILFGVARGFRTDEYSVQLPYYFSQAWNGYQQISHQMSISGQDMIVGYNAPVLNLSLLGKPFVWGYLLFGNDYGLSWYFCAKTILMFMAALEMFQILCRKKSLAVFGAIILTWAPAMQWWFSPHFYDVIFWAVVLFDVGYYFFYTQGWKKWGMTFLGVCSLTGFTLAIFPSLQVPCGIVMLALMCACLYRDRALWSWKKSNWLNVIAGALGLCVVLLPVLWQMKDALKALMSTVYPGSRVSSGGYGTGSMLFINTFSFLQPFIDPDVMNNSELSSYTHFAMAGMMAYPLVWMKMKEKQNPDRIVGNVLFIALLVEAFFLLVPIPTILARITLLSMCNRMQTVFGFTAAIFTIWIIHALMTCKIQDKARVGALICTVYGLFACACLPEQIIPVYADYFGNGLLYLCCIGLAIVFWLVFTSWSQLFFAFMMAWTVISGMTVNPIVQGSAAVHDYTFVKAAQPLIEEDPQALWLMTDSFSGPDLLLANGARVLNAVNFYPDMEKWNLIDPDQIYADEVNRYAHILVHLGSEEEGVQIKNPAPDSMMLQLPPSALAALNIRYLAGNEGDLQVLRQSQIPFTVLYEGEDGYFIFDLQPDSDGIA